MALACGTPIRVIITLLLAGKRSVSHMFMVANTPRADAKAASSLPICRYSSYCHMVAMTITAKCMPTTPVILNRD